VKGAGIMRKTIEERVDRIEKIFWVVGIIAVIFGVSGAWGYKVLSSAKTQLTDLDKKVEAFQNRVDEASISAKSEIDTKKDEAISDLKKEEEEEEAKGRLKNMASELVSEALNEHTKNSVEVTLSGVHIKSPGRHLRLELPVTKGDIVQATFAGSVNNSKFYYRIVDESKLSVTKSPDFAQLIQNGEDTWQSVVASRVFEVTRDGRLTLVVEFLRGDIKITESLRVDVAGARLIATKVAYGR